jgi:hypothetical protein
MIPYILTDNSLTIVVDGKALTMESSNPSFNEAKKLLSEEKYNELPDLFDTPKAVERFAEGNIKVSDGEVSYKGEVIHNHVVGRILDFMRQGLPYKPLTRFVEKLMENPSRRAVNELYAFLEHKNMPLTPDGNFLAYKGVRSDFTDWHSGQFTNKVGDVNEMPRRNVCDNANIGCSDGFHAGSLDYARQYGNGGHLMVVEIDPADVVSVPLDCDQQKLRTSKYKVVSLFEKKLEEPMCDDYGDYEGCYEDDSEDDCEDDSLDGFDQDSYEAGYEAAKNDLVKFAKSSPKRDAQGRFANS